MKILLLGELSGVHKELKNALEQKGHQVSLAHMGDTYRKFESDIHFYTAKETENKYLGWVKEILSQVTNMRKLVGFDVVQLITPKFFHWKVHLPLLQILKRYSKALVMVNTTCSFHFNKFVRTLAYSPCADCKHFDLEGRGCTYENAFEEAFEIKVFTLFDAIVSTAYEYYHAASLAGFEEKNFFIPLPIDTVVNALIPFEKSSKTVIYYGETRFGFKGGLYINEALDRLAESEWKDQVEIVRTTRLSFTEYQQVMNRCHIVLDQANTYSTGMNAFYAMAKGKIVLTSMEKEQLEFAGLEGEDCPAINIVPDASQIYKVLLNLLKMSFEDRLAISSASRAYVEKYHDSKCVAEQYLQLYQKVLNQNQPVRA